MSVSLRLVVLVITTFVAVAAAVLAFTPLYFAALTSAENTAKVFSTTVADSAASRVLSYLDKVQTVLGTMIVALGYNCVNLTSDNSVIALLGQGFTSTNVSCSMYLDDGRYYNFAMTSAYNSSVVSPDPSLLAVASAGNTKLQQVTLSYRFLANYTTFGLPFTQPNPYNATPRPFFPFIRNNRTWSPAFVDVSGLYASIFTGSPVYDARQKKDVGAFGIKLIVERNIAVFLSDIQVGLTGKILLLDCSSKSYFGGNFGEASVVTDSKTNTKRLATLSDVLDPSVREVIASLGEDTIYTCSSPCDFIIGQTSTSISRNSRRIVRILSLSDTFGLNMRIVVAIPSSDFLSEIHDKSIVGLATAAGAVVGLIIVAFLIMYWILLPLKRLEERIYASASFDDISDGTSSGSDTEGSSILQVLARKIFRSNRDSMLTEIHNIEEAYSKLQQELRKVKSFLPQSVLRQLEDGGNALGDADQQDGQDQSDATAQHRDATPTTPLGSATRVQHTEDHPSTRLDSVLPATHDGHVGLMLNVTHIGEANHVSTNSAAEHTLPIGDGMGQRQSMSASQNSASTSGGSAEENPIAIGDVFGVNGQRRGRSSQRSGRVGKVTRVPPPAKPTANGLNVASTLSTRRVTVVMGNIMQFHKTLEAIGHGELVKQHAAVVETILLVVNQAKGVLDSFHGDHFTITFNASTSCPAHGIRAAAVVLKTNEILRSRPGNKCSLLRFGAATGNALCGYFGTDRMRRFCTVGAVVNHAFSLMQQTRAEGVLNVVNSDAFELMNQEFVLQHVNFVVLPQAMDGRLISTLIDPELIRQSRMALEVSMINEGETQQSGLAPGLTPLPRDEVVRRINEAFEAFARGDLNAAKALTGRVPREYAGGLLKSLRSVMEMRAAVRH